MPLVVLGLVGITSLLVTLTFGGVFRRELRSLRRVVEEVRDELDVRVLGAKRRVQARRTRYGILKRAHTWRAFHRAAYETESAAGGAHHSPQATPRAALSAAVAPPASAPPWPLSEADGDPPDGAVARLTPTVVSMQPMPAPARREQLVRPRAPLARPDVIGIEDTDEAARAHLDPDEPTPRRGRAALLMPVFRAPEGEPA